MEEILVIFACLSSKGCTETSNLYYNTHPEIRQILKNSEDELKRRSNPFFISYVGPAIVAVAGGTGTVKINKHFNLQLNKDHATIGLSIML
jgi:hypothetical protein